MDEIVLIKLYYKYQMWFHKINQKHFKVDSEWFEYTRNDIELNAYNIVLQNYSFLKCEYNDKLFALSHMRTIVKVLIKNVRGRYEVVK